MSVAFYLQQIDAAYDVLLMDSMKQRMSGSSDVARSVRFADVAKPKKPKQVSEIFLTSLKWSSVVAIAAYYNMNA
jgi:hypothetical protein